MVTMIIKKTWTVCSPPSVGQQADKASNHLVNIEEQCFCSKTHKSNSQELVTNETAERRESARDTRPNKCYNMCPVL